VPDRLEVKRFSTLPEAELVASLLRDHGVDAAVVDREMANSAPHLLIALGGIRITAPDDQIARARDVLIRIERQAVDEGGDWMAEATPGRVGELDERQVHGVLGSMATVARIVIIVFLATPLMMCAGALLL